MKASKGNGDKKAARKLMQAEIDEHSMLWKTSPKFRKGVEQRTKGVGKRGATGKR